MGCSDFLSLSLSLPLPLSDDFRDVRKPTTADPDMQTGTCSCIRGHGKSECMLLDRVGKKKTVAWQDCSGHGMQVLASMLVLTN